MCGTPNYLAPEIIKGKRLGPASDLWSLGCIMYALLVGQPPFDSKSVQDTIVMIQKGKFNIPESLSPEARHLITGLLTKDP